MEKETWKPFPQILVDLYGYRLNRELGRARPSRWAWSLDGVTMSRADLLTCWGSMLAADPRVLVWYFPGRGCWTNRDKFKGEAAAQVLTLRDFIAKARTVKEGDQ